MTNKIIIAGGRDFSDYELLKSKCSAIINKLWKLSDIEIVSGGAKGADSLGEMFANEMGYDLKLFPADWDKNGMAAGPIRNKEMGDYSDYLIAFWDEKSKGTKHMINYAKSKGITVIICKYSNNKNKLF